MRQIFMAIMLALMFGGAARAAETRYRLTGENTKVEWTGTKPGGKHDGGFRKLIGTALLTEKSGLKLAVEVDCGSLYSDNFLLSIHLKTADLFAVKNYPKAKFRSTSVEQAESGYMVTGELTFLGKTQMVTFPATITAGETLTLRGRFVIDRQDFGMSYGKGKIDDRVEVRVHVNGAR